MMLSLVKPQYLVPVHGEHRHLIRHAALGHDMGIPESNTFVLEDGDVLELTQEEGRVVDKVQSGHVFIDGRYFLDMHSPIITERRRLAKDGVVVVSVTLSQSTGKVLSPPEVDSSGFAELDESQELFERTSKMVLTTLDQNGTAGLDLDEVKAKVTDSISKFLFKETRRRPTVFAIVDQV